MSDITAPAAVPSIQLADGRAIPQLGLGVWQVADEIASDAVRVALDSGYRHIDTAAIYANERGVGDGVRASGLPREDVWVTTKLWNDDQGGIDSARRALEASLERLGMDYVDLYLIHWASPARDRYVETWKALVQLRDEGLARSIGVSNFHPEHLKRAIDAAGEVPAINQVELHPYLQQRELRAAHERLGIATQGWSPLGQGGELLADPVVVEIAGQLGSAITPAQVVLRWHVQHGFVTIPKSQNAARIAANIDLFGFVLDDDQMARLDALDRGSAGRIGPDPATANF
ncbi:MAG: aldo/keto reductase [Thermoleophilia bacterium]|nr:aldo/keto reductase [Thermoleophilia bacterium]